MFLKDDDFKGVISNSPMFSVDLVVLYDGKVLLGRRVNRPARDYWFVPGGRVRKNESISAAVNRLSHGELGVILNLNDADTLGVFEHFYDDCFFGEGVSTHYVAYGLCVEKAVDLQCLPEGQHGAYKWWGLSEALASEHVHHFTKLYLNQIYS